MTREVTEAHYLHERSGLEAVLRPPVDDPTALAWIPKREELLVGTRAGEVHSVDPVLGTRIVASGIGEPASISVHPDRERILMVCRNGNWIIQSMRSGLIASGDHQMMANIDCFWLGEIALISGDEVDSRRLLAIRGDKVLSKVRLPEKVVCFPHPNGRPMLARSTPRGLQVIPFGKGSSFPKAETTGHRLRVSGNRVMGMTKTGVAIWDHEGGQPQSMSIPEVTAAAMSEDGSLMGMETRTGAVALAEMNSPDKRARLDLVKAYEGAVTSAAFSSRGRWLATAAERVQLWSWEQAS